MTNEQEFIIYLITSVPFTIVGCWAIYKFVKMNEKVKEAIVYEKRKRIETETKTQ